jgi:hypothetical protein
MDMNICIYDNLKKNSAGSKCIGIEKYWTKRDD